MVKTPTTFILGAGASMPYGFPSGEELMSDIIKIVLDRSDIFEYFGFGRKALSNFTKLLNLSQTPSIDA